MASHLFRSSGPVSIRLRARWSTWLFLATFAVASVATAESPPAVVGSDETTRPAVNADANGETPRGALTSRLEAERGFGDSTLIPHEHNYLMPLVGTTRINTAPYLETGFEPADAFRRAEVQFQVSLKTPLRRRALLTEGDAVYFGFTLEAWFQLYADRISSPFRETNYRPEIFYVAPLSYTWRGGRFVAGGGFVHESNGQIQGVSRSWNRFYALVAWERDDVVVGLKPWYRLPEDDEEFPGDPDGDNNPDILDFMGDGELRVAWRHGARETALTVRANPETGKGALDAAITFPLPGLFGGIFRGYANLFTGYGNALIDYDHYQTRLGVGISLSDLL